MIREGKMSDAERIVDLVGEFSTELGYDDFSRNDVLSLILRYLEDPISKAFVGEVEGMVFGFVLGTIVPYNFNPSKTVAIEIYWFVSPKARGNGLGRKLLHAFEGWAISMEVDYISLALEAGKIGDVVDRIYKRMGYTLRERTYAKMVGAEGP